MAISNIAITNGGVDIFTCPGTLVTDVQEHAVTCVIFCNISALSTTLTLHAPANNTPVSATNKIINTLTIPAGETFSFDTEKLVLTTGDKLHAIAGANSALVATVSSMRVS